MLSEFKVSFPAICEPRLGLGDVDGDDDGVTPVDAQLGKGCAYFVGWSLQRRREVHAGDDRPGLLGTLDAEPALDDIGHFVGLAFDVTDARLSCTERRQGITEMLFADDAQRSRFDGPRFPLHRVEQFGSLVVVESLPDDQA